jgi:ribosomal protein S18 acetylase RimI-like enzyme
MNILVADYNDSCHRAAIEALMAAYALDPMGGGQALPEYVLKSLCDGLNKTAGALTLLAYQEKQALGLLTAFSGFSTFKCQGLLNIHDIIVLKAYRGQGICRAMLATLEDIARQRACCKITLEVLEGNVAAQKVYRRSGFAGYQLDPSQGQALFWQKEIA